MENPYKTLGVNKNATKDEITKAYRKKAILYHPDKNKEAGSEDKFKEINDAYNYLIDETKRDFLDKTGRRMDNEDAERGASHFNGFPDGFSGFPGFPGGFPGGFPFGPGGPGGNFMHFQTSHSFNGPSPEQIKESKRKQLHIKMNIELSLDQMYSGIKRSIKYPRFRIINGEQKKEENEIEINIMPGVHLNSQIEIKEKGHVLIEHNNSEIVGSIIIVISQANHPIYERDSRKQENLICKKSLSFIEAMCGFSLELEHPSGKKLFFEYNDIIKQELQYKINNKGLPILDRKNSYGDLIFKFEIVYPDVINQEQKDKIAKIFNYKINDPSRPATEVITGTLIVSTDDDNNDDEEENINQGQSVQCAQS